MQGKRTLYAILSGLTALSLTTPAFSMLSVPYGWYLEANGGSSRISNYNYSGSVSSSGIGGNANIGYKFMPFFAAEIDYTQYANASVTDNSTDTKAATAKYYSYGLVGRGILPIMTSGFELFGKVGIQRLNAHVSLNNDVAASNLGITSSQHSATGLYIGAGGQYYFMPEAAINVQWARSQGNSTVGNGDLFSIGASFIFD